MDKFFSFLFASVLLAGTMTGFTVQANPAALSEAKARLACGTGTAIGAEARPDGSIKVTCQSSGRGAPVLAGGLSNGAAIGIGTVVVLCVILCGDGNPTAETSVNYGSD